MRFYYINSKGERLNFYDYPYLFQDGTLLDYSYSYDMVEGSRVFLQNVRHGAAEKRFKLAILPDHTKTAAEERRQALCAAADRVYSVFDYDVLHNTDGRLYTDTGFYLPCRILASSKSDWMTGIPYMFQEFTAVSTVGVWIGPVQKSFTTALETVSDGLDHPYDYPYDYAPSGTGTVFWSMDAVTDSDFQMLIYGPCVDPTVLINGQPHTVYTTLQESEYMMIDSRDHTVVKVTRTGTRINAYDDRSKVYSVFAKIPPDAVITWNGSFSFDITAFVERSEPKWS